MSSWHILISEEAYLDIKQARAYYNSIEKGLGLKFRKDLSETLQKIRFNPNNFGFRHNQFRTANLKIFPYQVHYITEAQNVLVFAVLHAGRKPSYISSRTK